MCPTSVERQEDGYRALRNQNLRTQETRFEDHTPQAVNCKMPYAPLYFPIWSTKRQCICSSALETPAMLLPLSSLYTYNSFKCPVTLSITLLGAGPIPSTVWLPLAIWVLPASAITSATSPRLIAVACNVSRSSSLLTCSATFA
jgi:hypothetical protein